MKIIGFSISKISGERKNPSKGKIEIKSNVDIKNIEKEDLPISNKPGLRFEFDFSIVYDPNIAEILLSGHVLTIDDNDESEEILKEWKKKKYTHSSKLPVLNFIMDKCNVKALLLEEELGLIKHLPMPKLQIQQNNQQSQSPANYAG